MGKLEKMSTRSATISAVTLVLIFWGLTGSAAVSEWNRKKTGDGWTWFEEYVFLWAKYRVACEDQRQCQVGMGIFAFGEPRGEKISFSGEREIITIGIGSLHIRPADGKGPVKAATAIDKAGLLSVKWDF